MNEQLERIRKELDQTDKNIVDNLARRQKLVREVSDLKIDRTTNIRDVGREEWLLNRVKKLARGAGLDRYFAEQIFRDIIEHSVRFQRHSLVDHHNATRDKNAVKVAYQGTDGAFSHQAAYHHFEERYESI